VWIPAIIGTAPSSSRCFEKGRHVMERFVNSLSDQTKDTLVWIIDFGIAFCLVCLTYQVMQGFKWLLAGDQ
jgi:hypothetical protein